MFEDKIIQLLNNVFDSYIEGIDHSKLTQMNLWGGKIVLNSLHIRPDLLDYLELPFHLTFGFLGSVTIKIQIPLLTLSRKNLSLDISDVLILLTMKPETQWDPELFRDEYITNKIALLSAESLELVVNQLEGNGFVWNTALSFLETLEVSIHNIHLRVEDYTTSNNVAYAFGCVIKNAFFTLNVDKAKEKNVDLPFQALFTDNGKLPQSVKYRTIDLEGFGLYIDQLDPMSHVKSLFSSGSTNINFDELNSDLNKDVETQQNTVKDQETVTRVSKSFKRPRKKRFSSKVYSRLSESTGVHKTSLFGGEQQNNNKEKSEQTENVIGHTNAIYTRVFSKVLNYLVTSKHDPNCNMFSEHPNGENNFNNTVWDKSNKPVGSYNMNYSTNYSRNTNRIRTSNMFKHGFNVNRRKRGTLSTNFKSERFEDSYMLTNFVRKSNVSNDKDKEVNNKEEEKEQTEKDKRENERENKYKKEKENSNEKELEEMSKTIKEQVLVSKSWRVYLSTFCSIKHKDKTKKKTSAEIITNSLRRRHMNKYPEEASQRNNTYMDLDEEGSELDLDLVEDEEQNDNEEYGKKERENKESNKINQEGEVQENRNRAHFESGYEEDTDKKLGHSADQSSVDDKDGKEVEILVDGEEGVDEILDEFEKRRFNYPETPVSNMRNLSDASSSSNDSNEVSSSSDGEVYNSDSTSEINSMDLSPGQSNTTQDVGSPSSYESESYADSTSVSYVTSHASNFSMGSSMNEVFSSSDDYGSSATGTSSYNEDEEESYQDSYDEEEEQHSMDSEYQEYKKNKEKKQEKEKEMRDECKNKENQNNKRDKKEDKKEDEKGDETTINFECKLHDAEGELQTPTTIDTPSNIRVETEGEEKEEEDEWTCITYMVNDDSKDKVNVFLEGLKKVEHNYILNTRDFKGLGSFYFCSYPILPSKKYTSCWSEWGAKYGRVHTHKNEYLPRCTIFLVFEDLDIIMSKEQIECVFNLNHNVIKYFYWISGITSTFESPRASPEDEKLYMEYWPQFLLSSPNISSQTDKNEKTSSDTEDNKENETQKNKENKERDGSYQESYDEEEEQHNSSRELESTNLDEFIMDYSEVSSYRSAKVLSGKELREFVSDFEILHSIPTIRILRNKASDGLNKLIRGFGKDPVSWMMGSNFNECITNLLFTNICSSYQPEDKALSGQLNSRLHDRLQFVGGIYEIVSKQANNSGMISSLKKLCTQQTFTVDIAVDLLFINSRIIVTNNMHTSTDETNVKGYILCANGLHMFYQDTYGRDGSQFVEFEASPFTIFSLDVSLREKEKHIMELNYNKECEYNTQRTHSTEQSSVDDKDGKEFVGTGRCVCSLLSGNPCILLTCGDCSADPLKKNKRNLLSILLGSDGEDYLLPPVFYMSSDYNHFRVPETSDVKLRLHVDSELFMHFPIIDELSHILRIYKYNMDKHANTFPIK